MSESRPFPPSARRLGLARQAGLHAASPVLVAGVAGGGAVLALAALGGAAASRAAGWIEAVCTQGVAVAPRLFTATRVGDSAEPLGASGPTDVAPPVLAPTGIAPTGIASAVFELALPLLVAIAVAALVAHLAQTRAPWLPRRKVTGAPALDGGASSRTRHAALALVSAAVVGGVVVAWLWLAAPRLAALPTRPLAGASLVASALATFAIAWVAVGVLDALMRHLDLAAALRMTARERRDDERASGSDPRWRALRRRLAAAPDLDTAVAGASLLLLGDDEAVTIAWDAVRRPIPTCTASGRRARATQLLALARRYRIPVYRDPRLAAALIGRAGPIAEAHWPRVAELVAALPTER